MVRFQKLALIFFPAVIALGLGKTAQAFVTDYGFGPQSASLGGMNTVSSNDGFAAYTNPARVGKGLNSKKLFRADWGIAYLNPTFDTIEDIIVENPVMSSISSPRYDNYDPSVSPGLGQWIGAEFLFWPEKGGAIGVSSFIPLTSLAEIDTGPIYHPEYVLFRTRWQRPKITVSGAIAPSENFRIGAGLDVGFSAAANADIFLQAGSGHASDQRLTATLKPSVAPLVGIEIDAADFEIGAVYRYKNETSLTLRTNGGARLFGSLNAAIDFGYVSNSVIAYDPHTFEFGVKSPKLGPVRLLGEVSYQVWSGAMMPPALISNAVDNDCQNVPAGGTCNQFQPTITPDSQTQNILIPKFGVEIEASTVVIRGGYSYRPSIFSALPTGVGNMVDPSRHLFAAGIEIPVQNRFKVMLHGQVQQLVQETVIKTSGDEFGAGTGEQKIGAPGYTIGGTVFGGGLSILVEI